MSDNHSRVFFFFIIFDIYLHIMKIDKQFKVRTIAGSAVIVAQGQYGADASKVITLNKTSVWLWEKFAELENFNQEDVKQALIDQYGIGEALASKDADSWISILTENNIIVD